jgi:hypothetical protein
MANEPYFQLSGPHFVLNGVRPWVRGIQLSPWLPRGGQTPMFTEPIEWGVSNSLVRRTHSHARLAEVRSRGSRCSPLNADTLV